MSTSASVAIKHGIADSLRHEINQTIKTLEEGLENLRQTKKDYRKLIKDLGIPKKFDKSYPWDDAIVGLSSVRPDINDAAFSAADLAETAREVFESLVFEASNSGCVEYYQSLKYNVDKITNDMRRGYAYFQPEILALAKKVGEAESLKWYFKNEHDGIVSDGKNFTRYALRASGG